MGVSGSLLCFCNLKSAFASAFRVEQAGMIRIILTFAMPDYTCDGANKHASE